MTGEDNTHLERDRGFLTKKDREYLLGETEYDDEQVERNRRSYIRNRIQNAIIDFSLLSALEDRDRNQIFKEISAQELNRPKPVRHDLVNGTIDALAFFYSTTEKSSLPFRELLSEAVQEADSNVVAVDFDVTYEEEAVESGAKKLAKGDALTQEEARALTQRLQESLPDVGPGARLDENHDSDG